MKTILSSLLICFTVTLSQAQSVKGEPTAVVYFQITPATEQMASLLGFGSFTHLALQLQKKNKKVIEIMDTSYEILENKLSDINGFKILPANTLEGKINYTKLGYPKTSFKKAAQKVDNQQLVKVDIQVVARSGGAFSTGVEGAEKTTTVKRQKLKPGIRLIMTFSDSDGNVTAKIKGNSLNIDSEVVFVNTTTVTSHETNRSVEFIKASVDDIPYYRYLGLALDDLIKNLKIE